MSLVEECPLRPPSWFLLYFYYKNDTITYRSFSPGEGMCSSSFCDFIHGRFIHSCNYLDTSDFLFLLSLIKQTHVPLRARIIFDLLSGGWKSFQTKLDTKLKTTSWKVPLFVRETALAQKLRIQTHSFALCWTVSGNRQTTKSFTTWWSDSFCCRESDFIKSH